MKSQNQLRLQTTDNSYPSVKPAAFAFLRIFLGIVWLFEVTVGHNWKIGGFTSGVHPGWLGAGAGEQVRFEANRAISEGTYGWFAWFNEAVVIPNAALASYSATILQVILGVVFIIGVAVRPWALIAIGMTIFIFLTGHSRIPPMFMAMHLVVLFAGAGMYYGLDGWIMARTRETKSAATKALRWLIEMPVLKREYNGPIIAACTVVAVILLLTVPTRETGRFVNVAHSLAVLTGLLGLGFYAAQLSGDRCAAIAATLRIFVGYMFLHEIWTRTVPGVNALPGFAGPEAQAGVFQQVVDNHWALFGWLTETAILPFMGFWVVVFATIQLAVGIALLVGYRTRFFGILGLLFLSALIVFGMTRYAPFLFGMLITVVALDGGRALSLDSMRASFVPRFGLPIPGALVPFLIVLAAVNAIAAIVTAFGLGIEPKAYVGSMASMTTAFVAIFSGLLAFVGWIQLHPELDYSGECEVTPNIPPMGRVPA